MTPSRQSGARCPNDILTSYHSLLCDSLRSAFASLVAFAPFNFLRSSPPSTCPGSSRRSTRTTTSERSSEESGTLSRPPAKHLCRRLVGEGESALEQLLVNMCTWGIFTESGRNLFKCFFYSNLCSTTSIYSIDLFVYVASF